MNHYEATSILIAAMEDDHETLSDLALETTPAERRYLLSAMDRISEAFSEVDRV